ATLNKFNTLPLDLSEQLLIFLAECSRINQVRPVAQRLLQSHSAAPTADLVVVAVHEHLRYPHAAKLRGPCVVRIVEQASRRASRTRISFRPLCLVGVCHERLLA